MCRRNTRGTPEKRWQPWCNEALDYAVLLESIQFATLNLYTAALFQNLIDIALRIQNVDTRSKGAVSWFKNTLIWTSHRCKAGH